MQNNKKMLIALDGSKHSLNAAKYVARTCNPESLKVDLLYVMATAPETFWDLEKDAHFKEKIQPKYTEWKKNIEETAQRFLNDARNVLIEAGVRENDVGAILQDREVGIARDIIVQSVRGYDAVVVGRRGLSKLQDSFIGSVSNKIIEGVREIPVWVIGGDTWSNRILLAVDASENSRKVVDYAGGFAVNSETELTLLHVVRNFGLGLMNSLNLRDQEIQGFMEEVEIDIRRMFRSYRATLETVGVEPAKISTKRTRESYTRAGDILQEAKEGGYGTIVMGRRGLSKVHEFLLGRVTNKVLQRAEKFAVWIVP